jgi:CPA1 family monovalent cation:H+ antiporter
MHEIELVLGLLVPVAVLAVLARRLGTPYPILLVLGGLALGFVPGLPHVALAPDLAFLLFLPPFLYTAAFFTSIRDFRAHLRPIATLAVGLVLATIVVVALVAHWAVPGLSWPAAFVLAAIVSPPDAVAATSVLQRLGAPRRMLTILEGESLVNDATALVAYRAAVAALATGVFSLWETGLRFVVVAVGGVLVGLFVAWLIGMIRERLQDPPVEITISLLTPFAAYLPAEELGLSGVLSVVAAGLYLGQRATRLMNAQTRVSGLAVWEFAIFVLTGLVFILIGLQLPLVLAALAERSLPLLLEQAAVVSLAAVAVRLAWVFVAEYAPLAPSTSGRDPDARPSWREALVVGWAGMRGVVSLAAALALPVLLPDGQPFPERDLIIFLTFGVILVTLVGQGLTLPWLLRRLGIGGDGTEEREELLARARAVEAALTRIDALAAEWPTHLPLIETLRSQYAHRLSHLAEPLSGDGAAAPDPDAEQEMLEHRKIRRAVIDAERAAVQQLVERGAVHEAVQRRIERDLDLEELRMEA